ncbi:hypothetical protein BD289DRAFT_436093 [Coniella lustricola]|uniref:Uncharacterized protein n=1 Tax=Coniella lustricola TaxID=2025994 RepID=A0A2T3A5M7_9PEZI|nr:hypothetical protein BD289DRAFT_436093 [Coniella lustricola]
MSTLFRQSTPLRLWHLVCVYVCAWPLQGSQILTCSTRSHCPLGGDGVMVISFWSRDLLVLFFLLFVCSVALCIACLPW